MSFLVPILTALLLLPPDSVKLMDAIPPLPPLNSPFAGVVVIDVTIDSGGNVQKASVVSGAPTFVQASLDAVQQWKFGAAPDGVEPQSVAITFLYRPRNYSASEGCNCRNRLSHQLAHLRRAWFTMRRIR